MGIKQKKAELRRGRNELLQDIAKDANDEILEWIQAGVDVRNTVDRHGNTPLMLGIKRPPYRFARIVLNDLIELSDVHAINDQKFNALMVAVLEGQYEIADTL